MEGSSFALRPAWGLIGVIAGTLVAVLLVPASGHYAHGALIPAGAAMTVGLLAGPVISGLRRPMTAFRVEHILAFGLVYWIMLDTLQSTSRLWDVSPETVRIVFVYTGLFGASMWIGSALTALLVPHAPPRSEPPDIGVQFLFLSGIACFLFGMAQPTVTCGFSPACLADALLASRFDVPWHGVGVKGFNTLLVTLRYFGYLTLPILVALVVLERRLSWRIVVLTPLTLAFLVLLIRDGGRKELGTVVGAAMLLWVLLRPRLNVLDVGKLIGAAAALLLMMEIMVAWRTVGVSRFFESDKPAPARGVDTVITVDWSFDWLAHVIQVVPERAPHTGTTGLVYIAGYPIPRSVWPTKPVQRGIDLPRLIGRQYPPGFSWNCTAVGDFYLIGGTLAICIGGLLYGLAANLGSRLLFRPATVRTRLLYAVVAMTLFLSLRAVYELTMQGVTVLAVWLLLLAHALVRRPSPAG